MRRNVAERIAPHQFRKADVRVVLAGLGVRVFTLTPETAALQYLDRGKFAEG